jgi:hypothetical protein
MKTKMLSIFILVMVIALPLAMTVSAQEGTAPPNPLATPTPTFIREGPILEAVPPNFVKKSPANGKTIHATRVTLEWQSAGTDITGYYHCVDQTDNGICDGNKWFWNNDTNRTLSDLDPVSTYYWQILACNKDACLGANHGEWWSFTVAAQIYLPLVTR